jgi:colanic acid biosynthesis glycosyl transferase WcaI
MTRPLRILVIGLNYAPDLIGIPKYTTELCEELVDRGHSVEVVTAPPYYPLWRVPIAYRRGRRREMSNGVAIWRVPIYVPAKPNGPKRIIHLMSFALSALPVALWRARNLKPDLVFTVAPALFSTPVALLAAKASGARSWLHIQDFELDAAFELGLLKGTHARRLGTWIERAILKSFDMVSTISPNMAARLFDKGVNPDAILEIRNWVNLDLIKVWSSSNTGYRSELGICAEAPVLLYSGNMASKQGLDVVAKTVRIFADRGYTAIFVLVGNGPFRHELEALCQDLPNVRFADLQPAERMSELLATADIHILPQRLEAADLVLPSKLPAMLASGRPSVVMAAPDTSLANEVAGAGLVVPPGDVEALVSALVYLIDQPELRHRMGHAARVMAESHWDRKAILNKFEVAALSLFHSRARPKRDGIKNLAPSALSLDNQSVGKRMDSLKSGSRLPASDHIDD